MLHDHAYALLDIQQLNNDMLMGQLAKEMENGRLLRIVMRLCMICERQGPDMDSEWSETGQQLACLDRATLAPWETDLHATFGVHCCMHS